MPVPFTAIRAFESAARSLSFKLAAEELGVTPTAVSHQIRNLEQVIGKRLFIRSTREVTLSEAGREFYQAVGPSIQTISGEFEKLLNPAARVTVTLGAAPLFSARWLVPRLGNFWESHPEIDLNIFHSNQPMWLQAGRFDLAIAWGDGKWGGLKTEEFLKVDISPVASPDLIDQYGGSVNLEDLGEVPLLHHGNHNNWRNWFRVFGLENEAEYQATVFQDANVALQATLSGRGVSLGILQLIQNELDARTLVRLARESIRPEEAYHLILPKEPSASGENQDVMNWLLEQIAAQQE